MLKTEKPFTKKSTKNSMSVSHVFLKIAFWGVSQRWSSKTQQTRFEKNLVEKLLRKNRLKKSKTECFSRRGESETTIQKISKKHLLGPLPFLASDLPTTGVWGPRFLFAGPLVLTAWA
jgi:hypothetical protein